MISLTLYQDEANAIERILDLILTNEAAAKAVFRDGAERRSVGRVSKKLGWARSADAA
tara:strand:+ start:335 stop:508 length:174 start_codon:yes stop_codon:yes gene_type:complete